MPNYTATDTAAEAVVGRDILADQPFARSPKNRALTGIAYTGSAAIGDTGIEIFIDEVRVGKFYNSALLTPQVNRDLQPLGALAVPAGAQIRAVVFDAANSSAVYVMVVVADLQ